jgi:hypothetical protein
MEDGVEICRNFPHARDITGLQWTWALLFPPKSAVAGEKILAAVNGRQGGLGGQIAFAAGEEIWPI